MLRIEPGKWLRNLFVRGTNSDIDPNLLKDGLYTDALNMRGTSVDGNSGSLKKLKGEVLVYTGTAPGALSYVCIGIISTNGHLVTFWANTLPGFPPIIQVDGIDMAMSDQIPYRYDRPLQLAPASDCGGGTIYTADHRSPPLFWSVQSLIDQYNLNSGYYFGGFSLSTVTVGLNAEAEFPITKQFDTLIDLGGSVGLPPGQYSYSLRYVTPLGDRTNWGPETPLIPVPVAYEGATLPPSMYPGGRTYGGFPNLLAPTRYGIRMYFRIFNPNGFESIEIKRRRYNDGVGLTGAGNEEVIARIPIFQNQFTPEYIFEDPVDSNLLEPIDPNVADEQVFSIMAPKTVEYAERRVIYGNFDVASSIPQLTFGEVGGKTVIPITKKLTKTIDGQEVPDGYDNPWQATYHKRYQSDDRYTPCVQLFNGNQGKFFAQAVTGAENFLFPNQHDLKDGDSLTYSDARCDGPTTTGVGTSQPVDATFLAVTQGTQVKKDVNTNVNVAAPDPLVRRFGVYYNLYGNPGGAPGETTNPDNFFYPTTACYRPWDPRDNQAGSGGYNIPPNTSRITQWPAGVGGIYEIPPGAPTFFYQDQIVQGGADSGGTVFAPTYHSMGMMIYEIGNIPANVTALTIGRTKAAGRVVAQGIGMYSINPSPLDTADYEYVALQPGTKSTTGWTAFFPDMAQGIVDQATMDDIQNFPQNYVMRAVSPRGFYSEVYGYCGFANGDPGDPDNIHFPWCGPCMAANGIDMISYARIQEDHGQVNIGEPGIGGMGVQPGIGSLSPPGNYPTWSNWRTDNITDGTPNPPPDAPNYSYWHESPDKGNALLNILSFAQRTSESSGGVSWGIQTNQYVYTPGGNDLMEGGQAHTAFTDPVVKRFHEPWYIIQILRLNAMVPEANSIPFVNTGVNIKMRSCIGIYGDPGQFNQIQDFKLLNERWEDCVNYLGNEYRYTYLAPPGGAQQVYLCLTGNTVINVATILADIASPQGFWLAPDGTEVRGLYEQIIDNNGERYLRYGFYSPNGIPTGTKIFVKFNGKNVRVFGGDTTVAPVVFAPIDREATFFDGVQNSLQSDNSLQIGGMPLPYPGFGMNPRWFMPEKNETEEQIFINYCRSIRQWVVMFDCETKQQPALLVNGQSVGGPNWQAQTFPHIHYIARRYKEVNFSTDAAGNGFFSQYDGDYPGEVGIWRRGGFRFLGGFNGDYAKLPDAEFIGIPQSGFTEKTHFCTGLIASNEFKFTQQDVPGLRTFTIQNLTELSEETGEIKLISSASSDAFGQNIYWWTQRGHGYVLTNKSVLTNSQGQLIGTQNTDEFWNNAVFMSRNIGLPDEFWRMFGKGVAPAGDTLVDAFFWPDRDDVYRLTPGNRALLIGRDKWLKKLLPALRSIGSGYDDRVTGYYDATKQEYLLCCIPSAIGPGIRTPYVFSAKRNEWQGSFGHIFDRYVVHEGQLMGGKRLLTYAIDSGGHIQNGLQMVAYGETVYAPEPGLIQEAQSFRVHPSKPTRIEIYDKDHNLVFFTDQAENGPNWILQIDGYEALAGRKNASIDPSQNRVQDEVLYLRIYYTNNEDSVLATAQLQLQQVV